VTVILADAPLPVPTRLVYPASEYHFQTAPVPRLPPVWVKVELLPVQTTDGVAVNEEGTTFGWVAVIVTLEAFEQVPLVIVHLNTLAPVPRPVTVVLGLVGAVIVPLPLTNVHKPVPTLGVLPAIVAVAQTVCAGPAFEGVTLASTVRTRLPVRFVGEQVDVAPVRIMVSLTV
jgi:hypothetical protein